MTARRTPAFREDRCNLCGKCLHLCPVLKLPLLEAKEEFKRLIEGTQTKYVLSRCNTCFSCNLYCPQEANPYQLILERWNDLYKSRGAPPLYRFVCPTETPNIWQLLNVFLSAAEKKWIDEWIHCEPAPNDTILLVGSYTHLFPFIIGGSQLLTYFKPVDRIDQWEAGAYLYQGGYLDVVQRIAKRCQEDFAKWGVKTVVPFLDAVEFLFKEVHPKEMGIPQVPAFKNFNQWLLEKIRAGEITFPTSLNLKVTIHDNCYSKVLKGVYWDPPREILRACGCEILEMRHNRGDALCCGFGAGASWVSNMALPFDIISEGVKKFREAEATGASALVTYCGGCLYLLWATRELSGSKMDVFHHVELVRMAMGEKINYPQDHISRAWDIIAIITYQLMNSLLQRNFFIKNLTYDARMSTFKPKKFLTLRLIRVLFRNSLIRKLYAKLFRIMMPKMKKKGA